MLLANLYRKAFYNSKEIKNPNHIPVHAVPILGSVIAKYPKNTPRITVITKINQITIGLVSSPITNSLSIINASTKAQRYLEFNIFKLP